MKKIFLSLLMVVMVCGAAQAQCVAEVKDIIIDNERGSIIIQTEYKLNGAFVQLGQTRYLETSGTKAEIVTKAKADIKQHCENLIMRISANRDAIKVEFLAHQKSLTEPLVSDLKTQAVGWTKTVNEAKRIFKGKEITVNADGTYTIVDIP